MKQIPKTVKIGCHDYEIVLQKGVEDDGVVCDALIKPSYLKILVERGLKVQVKRERLLHECIHGIFDSFPFEDDEVEEKIVTYLSPVLLQLLRENPELISYLTQ